MIYVWLVVAAIMAVYGLIRLNRSLTRARGLRREQVIRHYVLPAGLFETLRHRHPHLTIKDCQLVAQGLRQFFLAYHHSGYRYISMPSQVVDDLWHEFILHTRSYEEFCKQAFGHFLHHTPAAALGEQADKKGNAGLRRTWWHACRDENLNPRSALRLPLLFALDAKLLIASGFLYVLDCQGMRRASSDTSNSGAVIYCGGDLAGSFGDSGSGTGSGDSGCGGGHDNDSGSSSGGSSDSSSGCGGGGCGGGGGD